MLQQWYVFPCELLTSLLREGLEEGDGLLLLGRVGLAGEHLVYAEVSFFRCAQGASPRTNGVLPDKSFTSRLAPASQTWATARRREWRPERAAVRWQSRLLNLRQVRLRSGKQQDDIHGTKAG